MTRERKLKGEISGGPGEGISGIDENLNLGRRVREKEKEKKKEEEGQSKGQSTDGKRKIPASSTAATSLTTTSSPFFSLLFD